MENTSTTESVFNMLVKVLDTNCGYVGEEKAETVAKRIMQTGIIWEEKPLVLCGECKFWGRERISCEGLARCNTGETGVRYRNRNDFCSRGEKREEP